MIAFSVLSAFQRAQRSDHLGSSSVSYRADGQQTITQRYYPWGTIRPAPPQRPAHRLHLHRAVCFMAA